MRKQTQAARKIADGHRADYVDRSYIPCKDCIKRIGCNVRNGCKANIKPFNGIAYIL